MWRACKRSLPPNTPHSRSATHKSAPLAPASCARATTSSGSPNSTGNFCRSLSHDSTEGYLRMPRNCVCVCVRAARVRQEHGSSRGNTHSCRSDARGRVSLACAPAVPHLNAGSSGQ